jgi:hypothetical protein
MRVTQIETIRVPTLKSGQISPPPGPGLGLELRRPR